MAALSKAQRGALLHSPAGWIALGLGSGLSPWAPGTAGSLAALVPWLALRNLPWPHYLLLLVVSFALGIWACNQAGRLIDSHDHGALVWDEFVGQWLALWPLVAAPWPWVLAGFALFRVFDILKPWPIGWADRRCHGGFGVMLDDLLAGAAAAAVVWLVRALLVT